MAAKKELFRAVESWLTNNPGKNLADWRKETEYTGPALKIRNRRGEPVRVSYKGQSTAAQTRRAALEKPKTEEEAQYFRETKAQARQQSQSTEAMFVSEGKPLIAEHDVRLASGGTSEYMSISDPEFKVHKDTVEAEAYRRFGDQVIVDIDNVSGDVRLIPAKFHNKFQSTSEQPGIDIPIGSNIKEKLDEFAKTQIPDQTDAVEPEATVMASKETGATSEFDILNELEDLRSQFETSFKPTMKRFGGS